MSDHQNSRFTVDSSTLVMRLKSLYSHWGEHRNELWGNCNFFAVVTAPYSETVRYLKSIALCTWLFGFEIPETIMLFSDKQIHFICTQKVASLLHVVKPTAKEAVNVDTLMHVTAYDDDGSAQMDTILHAVIGQDKSSAILGVLLTEAPKGTQLQKWTEKLLSSRVALSDITAGLDELFAVKDALELTNVRNAAYLTASVMEKLVVPMLEKVRVDQKKVTHLSLMRETTKVIMEPYRINVSLNPNYIETCYHPIFQSGGNYDLSNRTSTNNDCLYYGSASVIICAFGAQYDSYCANIARTFLINPNASQRSAYEVLLKAHKAAIAALKPGEKANVVYKAAVLVVETEAPRLTKSLTESAGTGIGLELRELRLRLDAQNNVILKAGMVLNVTLGFKKLRSGCQIYSLRVGDTVIVTDNGHEVVTVLNPKVSQ